MNIRLLLVSQQGMEKSVNQITLANWDVASEEWVQKSGDFVFALFRYRLHLCSAETQAGTFRQAAKTRKNTSINTTISTLADT